VLCVLTKSKFCDCVTFKFYKVKNSEDVISNRQYILRAHYNKTYVDITFNLQWTQLTRNDTASFKGINASVEVDVKKYVDGYKTTNTSYYIC